MAKVALLIGTSAYEAGLHPLPAAAKDVEAMQQVLQHPDTGGFAGSDITVLKDADRQHMEEAIEQLFADRQKDDLVVFYFSGHGIKDDTGKLYLATRTTRKNPRGQLMRSSAVSASFVQDNMSRSRSKRQVVILDSCFSGAFAEGLSAKDDGTVNIREQLGGEGRAVLTSSSATEYSFDEKGSDLSIYTRYLIEGMTTGAADLDDDGAVSIDELHQYASAKVREIQPAMKPELYAIREGFKIRLTKVPPGDPTQKYRNEVRRYMSRGEVSFVGRKTLDALRNRLGLSAVDATAIEDEMLAASRQDFRDKLQQYERDFAEALQQDVALSEVDLTALRENLQRILGLRNEDTSPLEGRVKSRLEATKQHRDQYEQALAEALRQETPLSPTTRQRFQQMQQQWQLPHEDIARIESRIAAEIAAYRHRLQQYEEALTRATQQKYCLTIAQRHELLEEQHNLGLQDEDIAPIEARIDAEIQAYQQKLQQYEEALTQSMQHEYPFSDELRKELRRFQAVLELAAQDAAQIETKVVRRKAVAKIPLTSSTTTLSRDGGTQPENTSSVSPTTSQMTAEDFNVRGKARYDKQDYPGAIQEYTQALKLNSNDASAYYNRALARTAQGHTSGAIQDYAQVIKLNPNNAAAHYNRALALEYQGNKRLAIEDYQKAADLYQHEGKTSEYQDAVKQIEALQNWWTRWFSRRRRGVDGPVTNALGAVTRPFDPLFPYL
jgi:tetratricopeptide (TPR) repeat protein